MVSTGNVDLSRRYEFFNFVVSVHQAPHIPLALTDQDVSDNLSNLAFGNSSKISSILLFRLWTHHDSLILPIDGVPTIFVFLGKNKADGIDWWVNLFYPSKNNGDSSDASVFFISLELGLSSKSIWPLLWINWEKSLIWRSPCSHLLPTHTPMENEVIWVIGVPCN